MTSELARTKAKARAETVAKTIVGAFESGILPKALSRIFIDRGAFRCDTWSFTNKIFMALADTGLAMGFRQWLDAGRCVIKGTKAFHIWVPYISKDGNKKNSDGSDKTKLKGFGTRAVHRFEDTEEVDAAKWAKHAEKMAAAQDALARLPFRDVAEKWGMQVSAYSGKGSNALGWFCPSENSIGMGVENAATFAHELVHKADHMIGNLTERGQHWRSETVAELGGAALLFAAGYETEADLGGAFKYIKRYADKAGIDVFLACRQVIERTGKAVQLIIDAAAELGVVETETIPQETTTETVAA